MAIHAVDLDKAGAFYGDTLGFRLLNRTEDYLEYDTGTLLLYINRSAGPAAPIPSLSVKDITEARRILAESGCIVIDDRGDSLYFRDPFGVVFDVVED